MKSKSEKGKWKQLVSLLKATQPPKFLFGISLFLSLLTTLAGLAIPLLTSQLIDESEKEGLSFQVDNVNGTQLLVPSLEIQKF